MEWKTVPHQFRATVFGLIGYGVTVIFFTMSVVMPNAQHEAYVASQLIIRFEIGLFFYLAFIAIPLIGMGWAAILVLAYYRKRWICILSLAILAGYSYWSVSRELGHLVSLSEINKGQDFFLNVTEPGFLLYTIPLAVTLTLIVVLMFRPHAKKDSRTTNHI